MRYACNDCVPPQGGVCHLSYLSNTAVLRPVRLRFRRSKSYNTWPSALTNLGPQALVAAAGARSGWEPNDLTVGSNNLSTAAVRVRKSLEEPENDIRWLL